MTATDDAAFGKEQSLHWIPPPAPTHAVHRGRYARLEPLSLAEHADRLHARHLADADPASWRWLGYGPFDTLAEYRDWVARMTGDPDLALFALFDRERAPEPLGVAGYLRIDRAHGDIEIGHLHFTRALRRTRAATEAIALLIDHAFALGYRRLEWKCDADNAASRAAATRFGFTFEGIFRQHRVVKNRNRDTAWYSMLDHEWPARKDAFERWLVPENFDASGRQREALSRLITTPDKGQNP